MEKMKISFTRIIYAMPKRYIYDIYMIFKTRQIMFYCERGTIFTSYFWKKEGKI